MATDVRRECGRHWTERIRIARHKRLHLAAREQAIAKGEQLTEESVEEQQHEFTEVLLVECAEGGMAHCYSVLDMQHYILVRFRVAPAVRIDEACQGAERKISPRRKINKIFGQESYSSDFIF